MSGTKISDMELETIPDATGGFVPFIVTDSATGLDTGLSYRFNASAALALRVSYTALIASGGAALVGFQQSGTGALVSTAQAKMRQELNVEDFRESGDTDLEAFSKAVTRWLVIGGTLKAAASGSYDFGDFGTEQTIFSLPNENFSGTFDGNGCSITVNTTANVQVRLFQVDNCRGLTFRNFSASDSGFQETATRGLIGVALSQGSIGSYGIHFENVFVADAIAPVLCEGPSAGPRVKGLTGNIYATHCLYGINFANSGDEVAMDIDAYNCGRAYIGYGCNNHNINIRSFRDGDAIDAETGIIIVRIDDNNTSGININAFFSGALSYTPDGGVTPGNIVSYEHQNAVGASSIIRDINVSLSFASDVTDPYNVKTHAFRAYDANGGSLLATTAQIWRNISPSGSCAPGTGNNVHFYSLPTYRCVVPLAPNLASDRTLISGKNVAFRVAYNSEFFVTTGNLTNAPFLTLYANTMPAGALDFNLTATCYGTAPGAAVTNATCTNYVIQGTVTGGNFTYVTNAALTGDDWDRGTPATFTLDDATNTSFTITAVGADYDNADSYAVSTIMYNGQAPN